MTFDPSTARLAGRIGGYKKAARYPAADLTRSARAGFMARFEPKDPGLDEAERQRRTMAAFKAHMASLALKSSVARRKRNGKKDRDLQLLHRLRRPDVGPL